MIVYDYDYEGDICEETWASSPTSGGAVGVSRCQSLVPGGNKCDQDRIDFDLDFMGPKTADAEEWLACHEIGHSFGLKHTTDNYCMTTNGPHTSLRPRTTAAKSTPTTRDRIDDF